MGMIIGIMGESGSGKSASLRNFKKGEIFIFNVAGKQLPFRNDWEGYVRQNATYDKIKGDLKRAMANKENTIKSFVIDDSQYLMAFESFAHAQETGYGKFTVMAKNFEELLKFVRQDTPDDYIVYFLHHTEVDPLGRLKFKTLGKMLDSQLTIEGLMDSVILTQVEQGKYQFVTHNLNGGDSVKTPIGMFKENLIDNDLKLVDDSIREYYNIAIKKEAK